MKQSIYLLLAVGFVLFSCTSEEEAQEKAWDDAEKSFTSSCEKSYVDGFKSSLTPEIVQMVDMDELDKLADSQCGCMFDKIKEKYETPEEAFLNNYSKLMEEVEGCEPTEAELDKLMK